MEKNNKMNKEDLTTEYKKHLLSLEEKPLNVFLNEFESLDNYKYREKYIDTYFNFQILNILEQKEFQDGFYLSKQAKFIFDAVKEKNIDYFETLVYCYNVNSRDFNERVQEEKLKQELLKKGFTEQEPFNKEELKLLHNKKVICVFNRDRVGLMGAFTEKQEHQGTLIFIENKGFCAFLPPRHRTTGQILYTKFYYKEVKK